MSDRVYPYGFEIPAKNELKRVSNALVPHCKHIHFRAGDSFYPIDKKGVSYIHILQNGSYSVFRNVDKMWLGTGVAPAITGLSSMLNHQSFIFFKAETQCEGYCIEAEQAASLLDKEKLWRDVGVLLSFVIRFNHARDEEMVGLTTYEIIRNSLIVLHRSAPSIKESCSASSFVHKRTNLSKSHIAKVLSDLRKGGYIILDPRGRLLDISSLPTRY